MEPEHDLRVHASRLKLRLVMSPMPGPLRSSLGILRLGCIITPLAIIAILSSETYSSERRRAIEASRSYASLVQQYAERVIDTQSLLLDRINGEIPSLDLDEAGRAAAEETLRHLAESFDSVLGVAVVDAEGRFALSSQPYQTGLSVADRDYFRVMRDSDAPIHLDRVTTRLRGEEAVLIVKRRPGPVFDGLVVSAVSVRAFTDFFARVVEVEGASASLLRGDGLLLVRHYPGAEAIVLPETAPARRAIAAAPEGVYEALAISDGVRRIYGYTRVGALPVYANFGFATRTVWAAWLRTVAPTAGLLALAGLLGVAATTQALRREAAEEAQRSSDRLHRAFFANLSESLFVIGVGPDGAFTLEDANPEHDRCTAAVRAPGRGRAIRDLYPPEIAARFERNYARCLEADAPIRFEEELDFGDGPRLWDTALAPVRDAAGRITHLVGAARDVTERAQLERALREAQKTEALSRLVSGVAHDFNNILHVVIGNLDLLKRASEERRPRLIDNALRAAEQGRKITGQLLAYGRRQALRAEVVDVDRLIAGMDDMLAQSLRGDIKVVYALDGDLWPVEVDPAQLQTALINLAVNARDAMPEGGVLTIRTARTLHRDGERFEGVALTVADTGVGIPPEALARLGEPFFSTKKESGRGNGLGLAQVFGFVHQSGGSVDVRSEPGRGAAITLSFPRSRREAPAAVETVAAPPAPAAARRILLVEDNPQVAELAQGVLAEAGHHVERAADAEAALARLRTGETVDLVLSDLVMPGRIDGLVLARALRGERPGLPVLLMTGYSEAMAAAVAEGFAVLTKPFGPEALLARLGETLRRSEAAAGAEVIALPSRGESAARRASKA